MTIGTGTPLSRVGVYLHLADRLHRRIAQEGGAAQDADLGHGARRVDHALELDRSLESRPLGDLGVAGSHVHELARRFDSRADADRGRFARRRDRRTRCGPPCPGGRLPERRRQRRPPGTPGTLEHPRGAGSPRTSGRGSGGGWGSVTAGRATWVAGRAPRGRWGRAAAGEVRGRRAIGGGRPRCRAHSAPATVSWRGGEAVRAGSESRRGEARTRKHPTGSWPPSCPPRACEALC